MKKNIILFIIISIFIFFNTLLGKDSYFNIIKCKILKINKNYIKVYELKNKEEIIIHGKFTNLNKGDIVKIFIDKNKNIIKLKKIDFEMLRKRIKKIGKFKHRFKGHKYNRNIHHHR